jgi:flagellar L-ring protein precursor FlgH
MSVHGGSHVLKVGGTVALMLCVLMSTGSAHAQGAERAPTESSASAADTTVESRPARRSWTADRREFAVGDIITVLVDEFTLAAARTDDNAVDRRRRDAALGASAQAQGSALGDAAASFGTSNNAESRRRGDAVRENRFASEISVRITGIDPNGLLRIEGRKLVNVDKNSQEITLTGWVRPQDVGPYNTIASSRVGDAELLYNSKGNLGKPRGGIISRILGALWP